MYDDQIIPLLHEMSQLEKLTLYLVVYGRISFIDGTHLVNDILGKMSHLHAFIFNIITQTLPINQEFLPTSDEVLHPLIEKGYNADCYTAYNAIEMGQCHIYSLPFTMERMDIHTRSFPGGLFMSVRFLLVFDLYHSFEHDFFARISRSFPLVKKLVIMNPTRQTNKRTYQKDDPEQTSSIVEFSHLMILELSAASLDYVEQFFFDFNTRLPCINKLYVEYDLLVNATSHFTNDAARTNCSKLQHIIFSSKPMTYPENFYQYFPLL